MVLLVKSQENKIMEKKVIIFAFILFSYFFQSQIKQYDEAIDSIILKNSNKCFNFYLDKKNSYVNFEELTKDEGYVPTKIKISLSDNNRFNEIINGKIEYGYFIVYNYKFTIDESIFYTSFFRYNNTSLDDTLFIKKQVDYINSICSKFREGKFISPEKAESIAKQRGMSKIIYQSIDNHYYRTKKHTLKNIKKDVWVFKEENKKTRTLILNAKNGNLLADYNW